MVTKFENVHRSHTFDMIGFTDIMFGVPYLVDTKELKGALDEIDALEDFTLRIMYGITEDVKSIYLKCRAYREVDEDENGYVVERREMWSVTAHCPTVYEQLFSIQYSANLEYKKIEQVLDKILLCIEGVDEAELIRMERMYEEMQYDAEEKLEKLNILKDAINNRKS